MANVLNKYRGKWWKGRKVNGRRVGKKMNDERKQEHKYRNKGTGSLLSVKNCKLFASCF
jgi:hypothetical protein